MDSPGLFVWGLTLCACVSGLLFGYDTGVISSTLISINADLSHPLTTLDKSLITSSTSLAALLASAPAGLLADALGRKPLILAADLLFIFGALLQARATSVSTMVAGRAIVGVAIGAASFVTPLYIAELSPSAFRGRLVTVSSLFVTGGQVVAYIVGWGFSESDGGWRWMVGLGAGPAVLQAGMLLFMPETPRFLMGRGRVREAREVLGRVYSGLDGVVEKVLRRVQTEIQHEERAAPHSPKDDGSWRSRVQRATASFRALTAPGANRRALALACLLQGAQQLCGFNSLMYFSATIFALVGFASPTLTALSIALTNFAFTLLAFGAIDRVGRRAILLYSIPFMAAGLALCAGAFQFVDLAPDTSHPAQQTAGGVWPTAILASMVLFVAAYALGLGCVPWQQSELFPLSVRALGSALATSVNWGANTVVGVSFLPLMEWASPTGAFALYAGVCVGCWVLVWAVYPETAGLGLEEVGGLLQEGWGVRESVRRFKQRKRGRSGELDEGSSRN
ncbi:general substrate transporter [Boeremia exigua]|uniref:general substrate transporter n=1 Tax=Boeremia exigua TaxID=749465 RepID=UPI001E8E11D7|nr:general substrate transporter [Boeremia exigua]KAH6639851.1 general substrate transporter [Boeremia exigua]